MIVQFDALSRYETPLFHLCNPGCVYQDGVLTRSIGILTNTSDEELVLNFNAKSELNLRVHKVQNDDDEENSLFLDLYGKIANRREIFVDGFGFFVIADVKESFDGYEEYKDVTAYSCEQEIEDKKIPYVGDGTYPLLTTGVNEGILNILVSRLPKWQIGTVDTMTAGLYRTFEDVSTDQNILSFMLEDMQEAYECIFIFDPIYRIINVYDQNNYVVQTDIHITKDDLIDSATVEEDSSSLYTALSVIGNNDTSIATVNPLGTSVIYNFDYYLDWMSGALAAKVKEWQELVASCTDQYQSLSQQWADAFVDVSNAEAEVSRLEIVLDLYQRCRDNIVSVGINTADVVGFNSALAAYDGTTIPVDQTDVEALLTVIDGYISDTETELGEAQDALDDAQDAVDSIEADRAEMRAAVDVQTYFTDEEYDELASFIIEGDYRDDYIVITDQMTESEQVEQIIDMYRRGKTTLDNAAFPMQKYTIDVENFLFQSEFQHFSKQLETGCLVNVEVGEDDVAALFLTTITVNWYDRALSLTFGNRYNRFDPKSLFNDVLGNVQKSANSIEYLKTLMTPIANGELTAMQSAIANSRNLAKNMALTATNNAVVIDDTGYTGRRVLEDGESFDPKQIKIVNNQIVFTDDAWETAKTAIGEIPITSSTSKYGINAELVIGDLIVGSQLQIGYTGSGGTTQSITSALLESVTTQYYVSTSYTSTVGGSWSTTPPSSKPEGTYLWVRDKYNYANGDYEYSEAVCTEVATALANSTSAVTTAESKPDITYSTTAPTSADTGKAGDMWIVRNNGSHGTPPSSANGDTIYLWNEDTASWVTHLSGTTTIVPGAITTNLLAADVITSISSAQSAANGAQSTANGANYRSQLIYKSAQDRTSSMAGTTTWVTSISDSQDAWTTKRPTYDGDYPVLFVATQSQTVAQYNNGNGTECSCTTPIKDDTTTVIDGGHITTGTIDASAATITNIDADNITSGTLSADRIAADAIRIGAANLLRGTSQMLEDSTGYISWPNGRWYKSSTDSTGTLTFNYDISSDSPVAGVTKGVYIKKGSSGMIGIAQRAVPLRDDEDMCFSVWVKATAGAIIRLQPWYHDSSSVTIPTKDFTATGSWQRLSMRFTKSSDSGNTAYAAGYVYMTSGSAVNSTCYIAAPMMEYGNFPSSWSPSPDDVGVTGATVINGGNITTGTIDASKATITNINASNITSGALSADRINLGGYMAVKQSSLASASVGGYLGYTTVYNNSGVTSGGLQLSTTQSPTQATVDSTVLVTSDYAMIRKVSSSGISSVQANQYGVDIRGNVNIGINRGYSQNSGADLVVDSGFQRIGGIFVEMNGAKALGLLANYINNGTGLGVIRFYADDSNYISLNYDTLYNISALASKYTYGTVNDFDNMYVAVSAGGNPYVRFNKDDGTATQVIISETTGSLTTQYYDGTNWTTTSSTGSTANLNTSSTGTLVAAINEVNTKADSLNNDYLYETISGTATVASGTYKNIGSVDLTSGLWMIEFGGNWDTTNTTGYRKLVLSTSSTGGNIDRACVVCSAPTGNASNGYSQLHVIRNFSAGTYYFNVAQDSGSSLSFDYAYYRAVRLSNQQNN